ncbi:MAG TPA: VOC family protein [Dongiaceae bacterium]|nr:VOC family protein [Dongiaceae bacterium]
MRIDHLVWYSAELAAGEAWFSRRLDRAPAYGGVHPGEGTRNALVSLGEATYVEILARDPAQDPASLDPEIRALKGEGLYHWAVGGVPLEEIAERARGAAIPASGIVTGGRALPDGSRLGWRLLGIRDHGFGALVPFFIDWGASAHPAATAPLGGRLLGLELFSPRAPELGRLLTALGLDFPVTARQSPGFTATLESARGRHALASFDPLPRGFII